LNTTCTELFPANDPDNQSEIEGSAKKFRQAGNDISDSDSEEQDVVSPSTVPQGPEAYQDQGDKAVCERTSIDSLEV
jgi:hypothetical protein